VALASRLWQIFVIVDALPLGYVSTALHIVFAVLQTAAALSVARSSPRAA
jgi:hypothetical protein